jgi:hypothetical protein
MGATTLPTLAPSLSVVGPPIDEESVPMAFSELPSLHPVALPADALSSCVQPRVLRSKGMTPQALPFRRVPARSSARASQGVLSRRHRVEVSRVHATTMQTRRRASAVRPMADVVDVQARWNRTHEEFVREPMCIGGLKPAVTVDSSAEPRPALIRSSTVNLRPETFLGSQPGRFVEGVVMLVPTGVVL